MNLNIARKIILNNFNKKCHFIYKGSRNQFEEFDGIIKKVFPRVFIILLKDNKYYCFSYNDIVTKNLKILL